MIGIGILYARARVVGGQLPPVMVTMRQEMVDDIDNSCVIFHAGGTPEVNVVPQASCDEATKGYGGLGEASQ